MINLFNNNNSMKTHIHYHGIINFFITNYNIIFYYN
jgi:hypothetical protein